MSQESKKEREEGGKELEEKAVNKEVFPTEGRETVSRRRGGAQKEKMKQI